MKCQRCCRHEEARYRVHSELIDMKVCGACAAEAGRLGIAVELLVSLNFRLPTRVLAFTPRGEKPTSSPVIRLITLIRQFCYPFASPV